MLITALTAVGIVVPALLALHLFKAALLTFVTYPEALGLSVSVVFIFFSSTLLYIVVLGMDAIKNDHDILAVGLGVTTLSFGVDLAYCYFFELSLGRFLTALVLLYVFFLLCFVFMKTRELT